MSKGRRYDSEGKLNMKKVAAVIIAIAVVIMFVVGLKKLLNTEVKKDEKVIAINYFSVYTDGKWGIIDSNGNTVIEPTYSDMLQVPDKTKPVFICTYDINYNDNTYKTKAINEKNEQLFNKYEDIETIQNSDENNNLWYETNVLKVKKDGKYGVINLDGKEVVACEYDDITALKGVTNSLVTTKDGKKGLVDNTGSVIIDNNYKDIKALTDRYEDGYVVQDTSEKFGVINYNKKVALECKYDLVKNVIGNSSYVVKENGVLKVVNNEGQTYLEDKYTDIKDINDGIAIVKQGNSYGLVSLTGEEKVKISYQDLTYLFSNYYIAKKDNKYGIINTNNETIIDFNYTNLVYRKTADFIEGVKTAEETDLINRDMQIKATGIVSEVNTEKGYLKVRVNNEYKYYNFKFEEKKASDILKSNTLFLSKKDGKYGFVNKDNVVVVNYIYDDATEQNEYGFSAVKKNGVWGVIDQKGNVIVEPKYNLDNNAIVNFIGKWHISEDLNANYYTDSNN